MDDFKTPRTGTLDPRLFQRTPSGDHHTAAQDESRDRDSPSPFSDEAHRVDDGHGVDSAAVSASRQTSSQRQEQQHQQQRQERPPGQDQHPHQQRRTPETIVDDADATPLRDETADSPSAFSSVDDDAIDSSSDQHQQHQLHLDPRDGVRRHQGDAQHFTSDDPMSHERASQPQLRNYREELRAHQRRTHELFSRTVSAGSLNAPSALFRRQVISSTDRLTSASTTNGLTRRSSSQNDRQFLSSGGGAGVDEGPSRPPSSVGVASVSSGPSTTSAAAPIAAGGAAVFTAMTEQLRSSGSRTHDHDRRLQQETSTSADAAIRRQSDERAFVRQSSTTTAVAAGAGHVQTTGYEGGLGPRGPSTIVGADAATPRLNTDIPRRETGAAAVATSSGARPSEVFMRQSHDSRDMHVTPSAVPASSHLRAGTAFTSASAPTGLQPPSTVGPDVFTPSNFESPSERVRTFTGSSDAATAATVTVRADEFCALQATVAKLHVLVVELMADQAVNNGAVVAQNAAYQTLLDDARQTSERSAKVEVEAARVAEQSAAETAAVLADLARPVDFARLLLEAQQNVTGTGENDDAWLSPSKQLAEMNADLLARTAPSSSSAKRDRAVDQQRVQQRSEEAAQHQAHQPQDMSAASHYSDERGTYFDHANAVDASTIDADPQNRGNEDLVGRGVDGHRDGPLFAETAASVRASTAATIPHEPQRNHRGGVPAASSSSATRPPVGFSTQQRSTPPRQQPGSSSSRVGSGAIVEGSGAVGDVGGSEQSQVDTMRSTVVQEEITKAYAQVAAVLQENGRLRSERNAAREKLRGAERELRMAETALVGLHHEVDRLGRNIDAQVERKLLKAERSRRHASSASKR